MPPLENIRHEEFARLVASLETATSAYRKAYKCSTKSAVANGSRLLTNDNISARVREIQSERAEKSSLTKDELVMVLSNTVSAKPNDAGFDNPLCELKMSKAGPYVTFMDKSQASNLLSKLCGWQETKVKHEHSGEIGITVTEEKRIEILGKIRDVRLAVNRRN